MVLLKNDNNTLPITSRAQGRRGRRDRPLQVPSAARKRAPSTSLLTRAPAISVSRVCPRSRQAVGPAAGIKAAAGSGITVTSGSDPADADDADFVVVVVGLTPQDEGEDYTGASDRTELRRSTPSRRSRVAPGRAGHGGRGEEEADGRRHGGGERHHMPWIDCPRRRDGVVSGTGWRYGAGQGSLGPGGHANFSGKLPITWPKSAITGAVQRRTAATDVRLLRSDTATSTTRRRRSSPSDTASATRSSSTEAAAPLQRPAEGRGRAGGVTSRTPAPWLATRSPSSSLHSRTRRPAAPGRS